MAGNPEVSLDAGYKFEPQPERGPKITASFLVPISLRALPKRRREAAAAEGDALAEHARQLVIERSAQVAEAWIELARIERELACLRQEKSELDQLPLLDEPAEDKAVPGVGGFDDRGELEQAEVHLLLAELRVELAALEGQRQQQALRLSAEMGLAPSSQLRTTGQFPLPWLPEDRDWLSKDSFTRAPSVRAKMLEARAQRARAREIKAESGGELQLGLMWENEAPDMMVGGLAMAWTPAFFDQGERALASEEADALLAESEAQLALQDAMGEVSIAYHEIRHSAEHLANAEELAEKSRGILQKHRLAHSRRLASTLEFLWAQERARTSELMLIQAQSRYSLARMRLWLFFLSMSAEEGRGFGEGRELGAEGTR